MINPFLDVNWRPDLAERRKFGRSLVVGFPIIAAIMLVIARVQTHAWKPFPIWLGVVGAALGIVFWALPWLARPFYVVWYLVGCSIGLVVANVLLSAMYYLVLTPMGLLVRSLKQKRLSKGFDRSAPTYWREAEKVVDLKRYYRQF